MNGNSKKNRLKSLPQNLALSAMSLLFFILLFEFALRIAGYGKVEIYSRDPYVFWRLKPNQNCFTKVDHKPVRINSRGTRGREFAAPKPPGVIRILSLGDSTTFGWGMSDEETYSHLLEESLNKTLGPKQKFEVINAGCNGWGYPQLKSFFIHYGLQMEPDFIVVGGANLWTEFSEEASPEFKASFGRRILLKNLLRRSAIYHFVVEVQLARCYDRARTKFMPVESLASTNSATAVGPGEVYKRSLRELFTAARTNRVEPILLAIPPSAAFTSPNLTAARDARASVAAELGVTTLDLTDHWPQQTKKLYLEGDLVHPNTLGHQIIAEQLANFFIPRLRQ